LAQTIFTLTIFVSAFLLFLVQPLVGKLILPKLGGTPQVWNTCMVFFQSALLLGYAYTHSVSTRLKLRQQLMFHGALLAIPIVMLLLFPIYSTVHTWIPPAGSNPIPQTLLLLATIVGIPFFVVSTSAPLLQRWFGYSGHPNARDPYFLYSASNAGSLLSLLFYPAVIEPFTFLQTQAHIWLGGYVLLAALIAYCAFIIYKVAPPDEQLAAASAAAPPPPAEVPEAAAPAPAVETTTAVKSGPAPGARGIQRKKGMKVPGKFDDDKAAPAHLPIVARGATAEMTMWRRIRWVLLAAVPSSLMLGVTSYISTDLSPFPLVWIIPLALYLLSFIWVYTKWSWKGITVDWTGRRIQIFGPPGYTLHEIMLYLAQPLGIMILCYIVLNRGFDPFWATSFVMAGFFANALACHGELAEDRPDTRHLTEYFLMMSVGGAIGGIFNGIFAPIVFQGGVYEFYVAIVVACIVRSLYVPSGWFDELILQAFPGLQNWSRNQGDEMAKSMGRPAPHTTYLFNYFLDIVFGAFVLAIAYWLKTKFSETDWLARLLKFLSIDSRSWSRFAFNAIVYGIPMVFCFFFAGRPLRFTLAVTGLLLANLYFIDRGEDKILEARRTYFGLLRVMTDSDVVFSIPPAQYDAWVPDERVRDWLKLAPPEEREFLTIKPVISKDGELQPPIYPFTYLMHGTTYHGRNYTYSPDGDLAQHYKDASRLATTYYHRYGPVGFVMERDNYLPGPQNSFWTDNRLPTSMIGQIAAALGTGNLPLPALLETWSDTPYATIGLGTGTMASYSRPYQHMTYYEIDDVMRGFSVPRTPDGAEDPDTNGYFTYLQQAIRRGVNLEVVMGDARQSLQPAVKDRKGDVIGGEPTNFANAFIYFGNFSKIDPKTALKQHSYWTAKYDRMQRAPGDPQAPNLMPNRDNYYRAINVDAFSSDAIPIHLITKQAVEIYMSKLRDDGVLCVHTSNRHMNLVRPVARIALELGLGCIVGKDEAPKYGRGDRSIYLGHFSSEYVMVYRKECGFDDYVKKLKEQKDKLIEANVPMGKKEMDGKQILNSFVEWYNPYEDQFIVARNGQRFKTHAKVTREDSLWTDDYSYILGVLR
jgi:hypothetical protein